LLPVLFALHLGRCTNLPGETMKNPRPPAPPARKVVTRAPHKTVRVLNLGGCLSAPVECESSFERDFVYRAALCPTVVHIAHQPFGLRSRGGRSYTPDFLVRHMDGTEVVVEVKPASNVAGYRAVFDDASAHLTERGVGFLVLTEEHIRRNKAHRRAALILRYRKSAPSVSSCDAVLQRLGSASAGLSMGELVTESLQTQEVVLHLAATKAVYLSHELSLDDDAIITLNQDSEKRNAIRTQSWFDAQGWGPGAGVDASLE
jgi:hypothetical protein